MIVARRTNQTNQAKIKFKEATLLTKEEAETLLTEKERRYGCWWWLRSPGHGNDNAAGVDYDGSVSFLGRQANLYYGCVRPALIIDKSNSDNFNIGDTFEIEKYEFKIINENLAWLYKQDLGCHLFNEKLSDNYKSTNVYEDSDIKRYIDEWYKALMEEEG